MKWFIAWLRSIVAPEIKQLLEKAALVDDYKKLVDGLRVECERLKKASETPFQAPNDLQEIDYSGALHQFFTNTWVRYWFYQQERSVITRFKVDTDIANAAKHQGALACIEDMRNDLSAHSVAWLKAQAVKNG